MQPPSSGDAGDKASVRKGSGRIGFFDSGTRALDLLTVLQNSTDAKGRPHPWTINRPWETDRGDRGGAWESLATFLRTQYSWPTTADQIENFLTEKSHGLLTNEKKYKDFLHTIALVSEDTRPLYRRLVQKAQVERHRFGVWKAAKGDQDNRAACQAGRAAVSGIAAPHILRMAQCAISYSLA
jgi:hypothetical protein